MLNLRTIISTFGEMSLLAWHAHPNSTIGLFVIKVAQSIFPLGSAWLTKMLFDLLAQTLTTGIKAQFPRILLLLLIAQAVLTIFSHAVGHAEDYFNSELSRHIDFKIQSSSFQKINSLQGLAPFENPGFYETIQLGFQGAHMGVSQAFSIIVSILQNIITLTGFIGILLSYDPVLAILVALAALPQLFVETRLGRHRYRLALENNPLQRRAGYYTFLLSGVSFVKEIRLFQLGEYFLEAFKRLFWQINRAQRDQQKRELRSQFGLSAFSSMVSSGVFIAVVLQAYRGQISLGDVTLCTSAVGSVQGAISGLVFALASLNENVMFYNRYTDLMAIPQPIKIPESPRLLRPLTRAIEFRHVSFCYSPDHPWVLRDVNLAIPEGQCLALVGVNGVGKTTLVKLLTHLYDPTEGQILWNGVDIRGYDPVDLRRRIGVIFQDFVRYDLTALENIALGDIQKLENYDSEAIEEEVRKAALRTGIHQTIAALPHGYQTVLSRWLAEDGNGVDLSGGEWQKIALARLFMRDADLLILDEPTAALDAQAEYDIYHRFADLVNGKTSLLISHRFSTVRMADRIAVLEGGRITECGSHEELIALGGSYANLYEMQAGRYR